MTNVNELKPGRYMARPVSHWVTLVRTDYGEVPEVNVMFKVEGGQEAHLRARLTSESSEGFICASLSACGLNDGGLVSVQDLIKLNQAGALNSEKNVQLIFESNKHEDKKNGSTVHKVEIKRVQPVVTDEEILQSLKSYKN